MHVSGDPIPALFKIGGVFSACGKLCWISVVPDTCCPSQELSCSLRKTNPGVSLTIMAVEGDLSSATQLEVKKHGSLLLVDDIQFANFKLDGRCAAPHHNPQIIVTLARMPTLSKLFLSTAR